MDAVRLPFSLAVVDALRRTPPDVRYSDRMSNPEPSIITVRYIFGNQVAETTVDVKDFTDEESVVESLNAAIRGTETTLDVLLGKVL